MYSIHSNIRAIQKRHRETGVTLIEIILYAAMFAALSVILIKCLLVMLRSYTETRVNDDLLEAAQVSIERVSREVRSAISVDPSSSTFGTSPGVLQINTTNTSGVAKTEKFDLSSGALRFTDNGTVSGNFTGAQVSVTSLIFRNITTPSGGAVRIEMTIQSLRKPSTKTISVYDTIVLRGSYH